MASTRGMRKSPRNASPMANNTSTVASAETDTNIRRERSDAADDWVEPSLRTPAPSFEDHPRLERHGVLEQMAPLGTMPSTQKVKLRVRQWEPKQYEPSPQPQSKGRANTVSTPGPAGVGKEAEASERARQMEVRKGEDTSKKGSLREKEDEDSEYTPKVAARPSSSKSAKPAVVVPRPSSSNPQGRETLRSIVEAAVRRSKDIGNEAVGLAIQKVYYDSLNDKDVAVILDAVLHQVATPEQTQAFRGYIKIAKKAIKTDLPGQQGEQQPQPQQQPQAPKSRALTSTTMATKDLAPSSESLTNKSPAKRTRRSTSRYAIVDVNDNNASTPSRTRSRANGTMNGDEDSRPSKKIKRSRSVSSDSSALSSTHSMEIDQPEATDPNEPPSLRSRKVRGIAHRSHKTEIANDEVKSGTASAGAKNASPEDPTTTELRSKKQKLKQTFDQVDIHDSSIRADPVPAQPKEDKRTFPKLPLNTVSTKSHRPDDYDDLASPASSLTGEFLVPPPPGAMRVSRSRGATPNALGRPRNATRRYARVKMSPNKKKGAGTAPGRESSRLREREKDTNATATDSDSEDGENNDYCTACDLSGELLCCDGCPRSFHLQCLDPPLSSPPEGEWLCYHCESRRREPRPRPPRGLFALLGEELQKLNPKQFGLPDYLRNYFEGMKTGEDGEYEEVSHLKPKQRMLGSHDDPDKDNLKLKDGKGAIVLCFKCGKTSMGRREIINCDYCTLKWHLDCLDPPLANPPIRDLHSSNRVKNSWMCPAHSPMELETVGFGGQATHRLRKPRNAKVIESQLRRGLRNNGIIEIENDPSDDETGYDADDNIVYRVTEKSIKLDFIDRVHKMREEQALRRSATLEAVRKQKEMEALAQRNANIAFNTRSFMEKDTAISLLQFARADTNLNLGADEMQHMINALIATAPDETIALIEAEEKDAENSKATTNGTAESNNTSSMATPPRSDVQDRALTAKQKQSYLLIMDLIQKRLNEAENAE